MPEKRQQEQQVDARRQGLLGLLVLDSSQQHLLYLEQQQQQVLDQYDLDQRLWLYCLYPYQNPMLCCCRRQTSRRETQIRN